jgi:hypothetical protein
MTLCVINPLHRFKSNFTHLNGDIKMQPFFKKNALCLILISSILCSSIPASFANSPDDFSVSSDQEAALIKEKQKELAQIQLQLNEAHTTAEWEGLANALAVFAEVFFGSRAAIKYTFANAIREKESAVYTLGTALAVAAAHITYLRVSPNRRESDKERALEAQKASIQKLIDQLQAESDTPSNQ